MFCTFFVWSWFIARDYYLSRISRGTAHSFDRRRLPFRYIINVSVLVFNNNFLLYMYAQRVALHDKFRARNGTWTCVLCTYRVGSCSLPFSSSSDDEIHENGQVKQLFFRSNEFAQLSLLKTSLHDVTYLKEILAWDGPSLGHFTLENDVHIKRESNNFIFK